MKRTQLQETLDDLSQKIDSIQDKNIQAIQKTLLNLLEGIISDNDKLIEENQKLRDENNRLKGEQGKPKVRKQTSDKDVSSESDRKRGKKKKKKQSKKKKHKIKIDRVELCEVDKSQLPPDAEFKGYQSVVVQDIVIKTDNVQFNKKVYYSPSQKKTFIADLPNGYEGEFGPRLKALVLELHHDNKMTERSIHRFLSTHGIKISEATISRMITHKHEPFHREKQAIVAAGLSSNLPQQMDDTGARMKGKNYYTHILCNPWYTAYFTRPRKDRLTIIEILTQGEMTFVFNESTDALMEHMKLPEKQCIRLKDALKQKTMNRAEIDTLLSDLYPTPKKHTSTRRIILEASAIIAYQQSPEAIAVLLTDDAPQFKQITELLALCWVHDGRHYKKLNPVVPLHRTKLTDFLNRYWDYYHQLLDYKTQSTLAQSECLEKIFDTLFSTTTGYDQLDERIEKTKRKKDSLLLVLAHPALPLHNNASELGARTQARYRDISLHTINEKGTQAKDTFMTLVETAKKLSVNTYHYFYDRISGRYEMPSLAHLIENKGSVLIEDTG